MMHKRAIDFAIKHKISLGRISDDGTYYVRLREGEERKFYTGDYTDWKIVSMNSSCNSAIALMRQYIKRINN